MPGRLSVVTHSNGTFSWEEEVFVCACLCMWGGGRKCACMHACGHQCVQEGTSEHMSVCICVFHKMI